MSIIGKIHEIAFYGLLSLLAIIKFEILSVADIMSCALHPEGFNEVFLAYTFWSTILFIPVAIVGAFATRYADDGEGLSFSSDNIVVIMFAHIAEDLLGLVATPFWFLADLFGRTFNAGKVVDFVLYFLEIVFIALGFASLIV